jgi:ligand-binding sensor domain-containing protein
MIHSSRSSARTWALVGALAAAGAWGSLAGLPRLQATVPPELQELVDPNFVRVEVVGPHAPEVITRKIVQDATGDLWFATFSGVVRYDGELFTNVTQQASLQPVRAFALLRDREDDVWIGTLGAGVYRYDGSTYQQFTSLHGLAADGVLTMMEDRDGNLWFGHHDGGATRYNGTRFTAFGAQDGFTDGDVTSITQDGTGRIWFGTREGVFQFDGESFGTFEVSSVSMGGHVPTLVDMRGHLWFGGRGGLHHFDGARLRQVTSEPSWAMVERADGTLWFGGESTLWRVRPGSVVAESGPEILEVGSVNGPVFDLFEDRDGVLWIGTIGVAKLEDGRIRHLVVAPAPRDPDEVPDASESPESQGRESTVDEDPPSLRTPEGPGRGLPLEGA